MSKKITLISATLLSTTAMMGSGWLFSAQLVSAKAGNYAFLAWILAAVIIMLVAICYAKIVAIHPVRGATTRISSISHNSIFGMPFAFANWFGIIVTFTTEALATTQYLSGIKGLDGLVIPGSGLTVYGKLVSIFILVIYLIINFYGVRLLARVNNAVTVFKVVVPIAVVFLFVIYGLTHSGTANFNSSIPHNNYHIGSIFTAIVTGGLIYTFNGFQTSVAYSSEIQNPKKNVPLSLVLSVLIALCLYLALQYGYMAAVPHNYLVNHGGWAGLDFSSPLLQLATILGLNYLAVILVLDSVVSPSGTGYVYLGATSRMLYGMSSEGQMPKYFANLNPKFNLSRRALVFNFALGVGFLTFANSWSGLMLVVTGYNIMGYLAAPVSMAALSPKTRTFGLIVFVIIGMLLATISFKAKVYMFVSFVVLMIIYIPLQRKAFSLVKLVSLTAPFMIYTALLCIDSNIYIFGLISAVFYLIVTDHRFIKYCRSFANDSLSQSGLLAK